MKNQKLSLIPGYKPGSNLTIIDARYHYQRKEDDGKWSKDSITIVYQDNTTGQKKEYTIYEPEYTYYLLQPDKDIGYHQFFVKKDDLIPVTCKYHDLEKDIATKLGVLNEYMENRRMGNRQQNKLLHTDRRVFGSDIGINNYYRMLFKREYTNEFITPTKGFLDIEVDNKYAAGDFPEPGECPINAVSYLNFNKKELLTFLFDDGKNDQLKKFMQNFNDANFKHEFKDLLNFAIGGEERVKSFGLDTLTVSVHMFDNELDMLYQLFRYINQDRVDFLLAWNMAFDVPYIIKRIANLGVNPAEIMCDKEFPVVRCEYIIDQQHYNEYDRRGDYADISAYPVYLDQMIQFASRRKGQSVFQSMKLDDIGEAIAKVRKLDYSNITTNIADLPYLDYDIFVKYNMMDVIVQYCIESKTSDVDYVINKAIQNSTEYRKVHRQTVYLANRAITSFYEYGNYICGNNINKFKEKPTDKYEGAFVADPTLVDNSIKDRIGNYPINRVRNVIDFDFKALYPSLTREYNLAPNTQIGFINIPNKVYENENSLRNPKFTRSGAFIEDITSDNYIEFAHRWFGLATFKELYDDIFTYFNTISRPFSDDAVSFNIVSKKVCPFAVFEDDALKNVFGVINEPSPKYLPLSDSQKEFVKRIFGEDKNE